MDDDEKHMNDCCGNCKSFSSPNRSFKTKKGFCLKWKRSKVKTDYCGYHKPDIKVEYEIECGAPGKSHSQPKNHFSN